jgi:hypothetical protein
MRVLPPLLAAAAALLAPQAAQAAELEPLGACYRSVDVDARENVPVVARGFTPGEQVQVAIDGQPVKVNVGGEERDTVTVLPGGDIQGSVPAPYHASGQRPFTLTVTQVNQPANTDSETSRVAALGIKIKPRDARPSRKVRIRGLGFTDGEMVYAHYVRKDKVRKTVKLGPPRGACGRISVRRRQIPVRRPALGRWIMQVDNSPAYSPTPLGVWTIWKITVRHRHRSAPGR